MNITIQSRTFYSRVAVCVACLAVVALLALLPVAPARAQATCSATHTVQPGENLFRIALASGTRWPILQQINGLADPNHIIVGQVLCLVGTVTVPPVVVTPVPPVVVTPVPPTNGTGLTLPPNEIFPSIDFNTRSAGPGDTIQITGANFPTNEPVDIFIAPVGQPYPTVASGSATTASNGTLNTAFTVPSDVGGVALHGSLLSVQVRGRVTGYFGYNFFFNPRP